MGFMGLFRWFNHPIKKQLRGSVLIPAAVSPAPFLLSDTVDLYSFCKYRTEVISSEVLYRSAARTACQPFPLELQQ